MRAFGITQLVVAVNKMDGPLVRWDAGRFAGIKRALAPFLASLGFSASGVSFVPVSGLTGQNLAVTAGQALSERGKPVPPCTGARSADESRVGDGGGSASALNAAAVAAAAASEAASREAARAREMLADMGLDDVFDTSGPAAASSSGKGDGKASGSAQSSASWAPSDTDLTSLASWYNGPCLLGALERCKPPPARTLSLTREKPLRFVVSDVFRSPAQGLTAAGRLEGGYLLPHTRLAVVSPGGDDTHASGAGAVVTATVRNLTVNAAPVQLAVAGDVVDVGIGGVDDARLAPGAVLCWPSHPIPCVSRFKAQITALPDLPLPVVPGQQMTLHTLGWEEGCNVTKLLRTMRSAAEAEADGGGRTVTNKPRLLTGGQTAVVRIRLARPMPLETFDSHRRLGRFVLRYGSATVAAGMVLKLGGGGSE